MKYIDGENRNLIVFYSLEELIEQDNEVRLIVLFVDSLPLRADFYCIQPPQNLQYFRPKRPQKAPKSTWH
ncbi:MAG: hypothetical protein M0R38_08305 [Bacteroidia bacterium]|nr:hypothetical protein [Bacteroidia bacterium]